MPEVDDIYRSSKEYHLVYCELIRAARYRGTVTYQEIVEIVGLTLTGNYMGSALGDLLGEIAEDEHDQGRPMLSAVAVGSSGSPGPGFFRLARQLGKLQAETKEAERQFWSEEQQAAYDTWRRELKTDTGMCNF